MIKKLLITIFITFIPFCNANDTKWRVRDFGTLSTFTEAYVKEFNDHGQVLIAGRKQGETYWNPRPNLIEKPGKICSWAFFDPKLGLVPINDLSKTSESHWYRINRQGLVLGLSKATAYERTSKKVEFYPTLITWQPGTEYKSYSLPIVPSEHQSSQEAFIAHCRNSDSTVVTCMYSLEKGKSYQSRVFSLENGKILDLTPKLRQEAKTFGYDAGDFLIICVNGQGNMLGRFDFYVSNPFKGRKNAIGTKYFLWDNIQMLLVDNPDEFSGIIGRESNQDLYHTFLDSNNQILFDVFVENIRYKQSWVWSEEEGLKRLYPEQSLEMAPGRGWGHAIGLLDDGTILWTINNYNEFNGFLFQYGSQQNRLPLDKYRQPLPDQIGQFYDIKSNISILNGTWPLNDKYHQKYSTGGEFNANCLHQVFFTGKLFGEEHPFFIEPVKDD